MAKTYRLTPMRRFINLVIGTLVRFGRGPEQTYILTVRGRKSGKPYSTPVSLVKDGSRRWLVAPYGEVSWVRNARAAGRVQLSRGSTKETVSIQEVGPQESAPVLKEYVRLEPFTLPYFDAAPDAPLEAFEAEAARHPVFRIEGSTEAM